MDMETKTPKKAGVFRVWGKMLPYIKPYRKWVAAIIAAMLLDACIAVAYTLIAGYVVESRPLPSSIPAWC